MSNNAASKACFNWFPNLQDHIVKDSLFLYMCRNHSKYKNADGMLS